MLVFNKMFNKFKLKLRSLINSGQRLCEKNKLAFLWLGYLIIIVLLWLFCSVKYFF